jgi:histidyl-tRNA synthetase
MSSQSTKPARGMRDFLPADVRRRTYVIDVVRDVYERYGFEPLETPAVENLDTLMGKYGEEGNQLIFPILKRGEQFTSSLEQVKQGAASGAAKDLADLALRYDLTVPLARVMAEYRAQLPKFFKRYQIQPVWRADRPARGRFREFYQCDVDICGSKSLIVEAEMCAAVSDVLITLGFTNFAIRLNHRQLLAAIIDVAGVPADRTGDALVALDKLDKIGRDGVLKDMTARQIDEAAAIRLLGLFAGEGDGSSADGPVPVDAASNGATLQKLAAFVGDHAVGKAALDDLRTILAYATPTSAHGRLAIDPSLARGLSYYTGAIVEVAVSDLAGSLGGGGRYDNLVGMFSNQSVPAAGFSLGLERIIVVMTERGMFPPSLDADAAPAEVMVTVWNAEKIGDALALARDLRAAELPGGRRLRVDVYPEADKIGKQFKYAGDRKIPYVVVAGDDELAQGTVTIKNMRTAEQKTVRREEAATALLES